MAIPITQMEVKVDGIWTDYQGQFKSFEFTRGDFDNQAIGGLARPATGILVLGPNLTAPFNMAFDNDLFDYEFRATINGDRQFTGFLGGHEWEADNKGNIMLKIQLRGQLAKAGNYFDGVFTGFDQYEIRTSDVVIAILDALEVPKATSSGVDIFPEVPRQISVGQIGVYGPEVQNQVTAKNNTRSFPAQNALDLIAKTELAYMYENAAGTIIFENRNTRVSLMRQSPHHIISNVRNLYFGRTIETVINRVDTDAENYINSPDTKIKFIYGVTEWTEVVPPGGLVATLDFDNSDPTDQAFVVGPLVSNPQFCDIDETVTITHDGRQMFVNIPNTTMQNKTTNINTDFMRGTVAKLVSKSRLTRTNENSIAKYGVRSFRYPFQLIFDNPQSNSPIIAALQYYVNNRGEPLVIVKVDCLDYDSSDYTGIDVADLVTLNLPNYGIRAKEFWVMKVTRKHETGKEILTSLELMEAIAQIDSFPDGTPRGAHTVPGVPGLSIASITATSFHMVATYNQTGYSGSDRELHYQYKKASDTAWINATGATVSGLTATNPGERYFARVRARRTSNTAIFSPWKTEAFNLLDSGVTPPPVTPEPPAPVTVLAPTISAAAIDSSSIRVTLGRPATGGPYSSLELQVKQGSSSYAALTTYTGAALTATQHYTHSPLSVSTKYDYRARVTNAAGTSNWATASATTNSLTPPPAPTAMQPSKVLGLAVAAVTNGGNATWTAEANSNRYEIQWQSALSSTTSTNWANRAFVTTNSYSIGSLLGGSGYTARVRGINDSATATTGPWSDAVNFTPTQGLSQVTGLSATPGDKRITFSWSLPAGLPTGYRFEYYGGTILSTAPQTGNLSSASTRSRLVTGLTNGITYYFRVRAVKGSTLGPWSSYASATPQPATPGPVGNIFIKTPAYEPFTTGTPGSTLTTWTAPTSGPAVHYYEFDYRQATAGPGRGWQSNTSNSRSFTLENLEAGEPFYVRIRAVAFSGNKGIYATASINNVLASTR